MTLGRAELQQYLFDELSRFCEATLPSDSLYAWLHGEREQLFPDELFADLFATQGRRSVPPSVVATVMVLQRLEGCSDREAAERYSDDVRWRYAAGVGGYGDQGGRERFVHTVLVDMRERLRRSERPDRVFERTLEAARAAGLVGRRRVLDSTPLYDAVATMDTVTLIRSALRGLLRVTDAELAAQLRAVLRSGDDYASAAKPQIDWDDAEARAALIDSRAQDAYACLALLEGGDLEAEVTAAMQLLATVVGQDLERGPDGRLRIARRVAPDRVISTVDPETRHGHKTAARGFDGYKGHIALDPDSELITAVAVTPGNAGDASVAAELIQELLSPGAPEAPAADDPAPPDPEAASGRAPAVVYGDQAYGTGAFQEQLAAAGLTSRCKTALPHPRGGIFPKDRFRIDLEGATVTCPAELTVPLHRTRDGGGWAEFGAACADCPLRAGCTTAAEGRTITVGPHEAALAAARRAQADPAWTADYRATRPLVERKQAHLVRRKHGGRHARMRGAMRIAADFCWLAAGANLARLARLGLHGLGAGRWGLAEPTQP